MCPQVPVIRDTDLRADVMPGYTDFRTGEVHYMLTESAPDARTPA